jgi:rubrerythrin
MKLKGSKTEHNLLAAFAGESQARNRYTYFASAARKEGYRQIEAIFLETAENEKEHGKRFFSFLQGGDVTITAAYPAGPVGTTAENLAAAAAGEHLEWTQLYVDAAGIARDEGFPEIGAQFDSIAAVETWHEKRYLKLLERVKNGTVFKREQKVLWKCRNCGRVIEGTEPPKKCPTCLHPQEYFEIYDENY